MKEKEEKPLEEGCEETTLPMEKGAVKAAPASEEEAVRKLEDEIDACKKEAGENLGKYLRKCADFENYKKRAEKEKAAISEFANEALIKEILPVLDNLERVIEHSKEGAAEEAVARLKEGAELTLKHLRDVLNKSGVEEIKADGVKFDPSRHEALGHEETDCLESGTVTKVVQRGYTLNERLLRPALVMVAAEPREKER